MKLQIIERGNNMNRKLFGLLLSSFTFISIIGTGFAQWHFKESYNTTLQVDNVSGEGNIEGIAESLNLATLSVSNFAYTLGQGDNYQDVTEGIIVTSKPIITLQLTKDFISSFELKTYKVTDITFNYTVSISSTNGLASYVELYQGTTGTFKCDATGLASKEINLSFKYKDNKKPRSSDDLNKMSIAKQEQDLLLKVVVTAILPGV